MGHIVEISIFAGVMHRAASGVGSVLIDVRIVRQGLQAGLVRADKSSEALLDRGYVRRFRLDPLVLAKDAIFDGVLSAGPLPW
jgi:hypothetical protein